MNRTDRKEQRIFDIVIGACLWCCALFTVAVFIYGQFFMKNPSPYGDRCELYDAVWTYTDPEGVTAQYAAPAVFSVKGVDDVRLTTTLPDEVLSGDCLFIKTGKDLDAYVDGELRNSYRISRSVFGRTVKGMWLPITLGENDGGKTLTLIRPGYWLDEYVLGEVMIGNRLGFAVRLIHDNLFILILGFAIITFVLVITAICLVYRIRNRRSFPLWYLCLGVLCGAAWMMLDNYAYPLFFQNYYVDGVTEFLVLMLLPLPFAAYIDILLEHRYQRYYNAIRAVIAATFIVISALYFSDVADFNETMPVSNLIAGLVALFLFAEIIFDTFVRGHRENKVIAIGFSIFVMLCILEIIHLNLTVHTNDGVFVAMGLLVLLVVAVTYEVKRISELRAETLEAQKANQAKTTFLANMSHEIRTPINAILGMDELILREDTSPSVREYALNIKSAGTALLEIISDVLDFSKIEQGKMEIINAEYDSRLLLNSIITMIKVRTEEKGLNFVRNISPELPSKLVGDEKHIREVMINLLSNAVKYTPKGSVTFTVRHEKKGDGRCDLFISVKDTGIGIKESDMGRLFNQFERLDQKKTRSVEGTGLGLAISANLIRLMEGDIECESTYGKGSEFTVRLPQIITDETPIGDIGTGDPDASLILQEEEPESLEGIKVLVVDDNAMNLKVARGLLKKLDAEVASCRSGAEMLEIIKRKKFDVILLDHLMPEMDGIETLEKARSLEDSLNKDTPFIALTANAIAGAREMYLENGFSDYLSKPMTLKELSDTILSNLGRKTGA